MMDWAGIKRVSTVVFAQIAGLPLSQVCWHDESEGTKWTPDPRLEIHMEGPRQIGQDEERRDDTKDGTLSDPSTNEGIVTVCGPREFTLTLACESLVQDIADKRNGAAILSNLLTRLNRTSTVEALNPFYAVSDWTDIQRVPYRDKEGRWINRYVIDLLCLAADNDVDTTVGAGAWIGEVIGSGTVTDGVVTETVTFDVKEGS